MKKAAVKKVKRTGRATAKKTKGAARTEKLVSALRRWQEIERQSVEHSAEIMEKTDNPLVRQVMEIIRNDSVQHHRVQQFIIDSMTTTPVRLKPEELAEIWDEIQKHDEAEREVIKLGKELRDECTFFVQRTLLDYLIYDEEKHDKLLGDLERFKSDLYPYA
jgi:lipopolysaccharide biosynthesis regulator YciM